jgi:hypothetical protein
MLRAKRRFIFLTEIDVTNSDAYGTEFAPKAQATIKAAGGKLSSSEEPEVPMRNQSTQLKAHRPSVLLHSNGKASKQ